MSDDPGLVVDGVSVRFVPTGSEAMRVLADDVDIGSLEPAGDGSGYLARRAGGEPLTRASQWGGEVSLRFGSKALAARALLELR